MLENSEIFNLSALVLMNCSSNIMSLLKMSRKGEYFFLVSSRMWWSQQLWELLLKFRGVEWQTRHLNTMTLNSRNFNSLHIHTTSSYRQCGFQNVLNFSICLLRSFPLKIIKFAPFFVKRVINKNLTFRCPALLEIEKLIKVSNFRFRVLFQR